MMQIAFLAAVTYSKAFSSYESGKHIKTMKTEINKQCNSSCFSVAKPEQKKVHTLKLMS